MAAEETLNKLLRGRIAALCGARLTVLIAALTLGACASAPQTRAPALDLPAAWPGAEPLAAAVALPDAWWTAFGDPHLDALIDEALAHNADIARAAARIEEARANLGLIDGERWPSVSAGIDVNRSRRSERGAMPIPTPVSGHHGVGVQAAFELDLWGRLRHASEAARAELLASRFGRETARLALIDQLIQGYFALRTLDARHALATASLENRRAALDLARRRMEVGLSNELELRQAEAEEAALAAELVLLKGRIAAQERALAVLVGRSPRALLAPDIARGASIDRLPAPPTIAAGLPSELLQNRPDLREREARLAAAGARIKSLRAAIYPSLALTAQLGSESRALTDLFSGPATVWSLAAGLSQTLFNAGRSEHAVEGAAARREQALLDYEQAVRQAFAEVLDALVAHRQAVEAHTAESRRAQALTAALELAEKRHAVGLVAHIEVLDAQRQLHLAEAARIEAQRQRLGAVATLYKALGGGFIANP